MKKFIASLAVLLCAGYAANAQDIALSASATCEVEIRAIQPIMIECVEDQMDPFNYGYIAPGQTRSWDAGQPGGLAWMVTGEPGAQFSFDVTSPTSLNTTPVNATPLTLSVNTIYAGDDNTFGTSSQVFSDPSSHTFDNVGPIASDKFFWAGISISAPANMLPGTYSGNVNATVAYINL